MEPEFNDSQPIYRQLRDRVVAMILDGLLKEGDPLPSVRQVATDTRVNPLTVLKAYQQLTDEGLVEKKRGVGLFVSAGARELRRRGARQRFLGDQWPEICAPILRLGRADQLLGRTGAGHGLPASPRTSEDVPPDRRAGRGRPPR